MAAVPALGAFGRDFGGREGHGEQAKVKARRERGKVRVRRA
jgi:hypothetical protein